MTLIDGCFWHEGNADMLQMRFGVDLSLLMMIVNYSVFYLDPICSYWAEMPVTRRSERAQGKGNAAPIRLPTQSP